MRIAFFTETFFPQVNGVVTSVASFTRELQRQGHEVEIFAPAPGDASYNSAAVHRFRSLSFKPYPEYKAALFPHRAVDIVKRGNFDVIHTHGPFALGWAGVYCSKRFKIPAVSTFHTPVSDYVPYLFGDRDRLVYLGNKVAWSYCRRHYNRYNGVISPSKVIRKVLKKHRIRPECSIIKTGVELENFDKVKGSVKKKYGVDDFILHTGRLSHEKNVNVILDSMPVVLEEFPKLKLVITSDGPARKGLEAQAKKLGIQKSVLFTGYIPWDEWDDMIRLYKEAECTVIASEAETQGMVILEAMACGTPVVGADYLATPETISDGKNGYLFPLNDSKKLAEETVALVSSDSKRKKLSKGARKTAEDNTMQKWTERLVKLYSTF